METAGSASPLGTQRRLTHAPAGWQDPGLTLSQGRERDPAQTLGPDLVVVREGRGVQGQFMAEATTPSYRFSLIGPQHSEHSGDANGKRTLLELLSLEARIQF